MTEPLLPIFRKPKAVSKKQKRKERYWSEKQRGFAVFTPYEDKDKEKLKKAVCKSIMKRYHKDEKFKKKMNQRRALLLRRQKQRERGEIKLCNKCHTKKPLCDFETRSSTDKRPRHECKVCRKERNRLYYLKNKEKWAKNDD
jgi:hypothetical protein